MSIGTAEPLIGAHPVEKEPGAPSLHRNLVVSEITEMWNYASQHGIARELKRLHRPKLWRSLLAVLGDWLLIGLATGAIFEFGRAMIPVSVLVIGNRQRALGNMLHDASHWSFDGHRTRSGILANLLLCCPLWVSMTLYRNDHTQHHRYLGDPTRDPDYIHDEKRLSHGWWAVWLDQILSRRMFGSSLFAHLPRMNVAQLAGVVLWWTTALTLIAVASNVTAALIFLGLWVAAKATVFHVITSFREISDHVGLTPGGLISFSRNHPFSSMLGQLFHPHHNGYHLLHHLMPGLPYHALPSAHAALISWQPYATGEQCDSYFLGDKSAVRSWVRRWGSGRTQEAAS